MEEVVVDKSHPFGDDLKKIPREDLGVFLLDDQNKKITLNDPNLLLRIASEKAVPFKFSYTAKKYNFIDKNLNQDNKYLVVGKIYLKVDYYNSTGEIDEEGLRIYLFDRILK